MGVAKLALLLSFATLPLYPKSFEGFVQAQWTGPAGFGPTWVFLRNAMAANVLFTALVLVAHHRVAWAGVGRRVAARQPAG